ncbi:MAG: holo-ACP synthase [Halanaerobiales bacterium]|nr:holo-ACP synthase [Halanaerobiales bacterium]
MERDKIEGIIGIGIDILEVKRLKKIFNDKKEKFIKRIYTNNEINYCENKKKYLQSYAVRFSAKEAFIKAIDSKSNIAYKDIEIINKSSNKPKVILYRSALKAAQEKKVINILISLSHEKNYVISNIILKGKL